MVYILRRPGASIFTFWEPPTGLSKINSIHTCTYQSKMPISHKTIIFDDFVGASWKKASVLMNFPNIFLEIFMWKIPQEDYLGTNSSDTTKTRALPLVQEVFYSSMGKGLRVKVTSWGFTGLVCGSVIYTYRYYSRSYTNGWEREFHIYGMH